MYFNDTVALYLQLLVTVLAFGIGFPSLLFDRPIWLRRVRKRYSIFNGVHLLIVIALIAIALFLLGYLFSPKRFVEIYTNKIHFRSLLQKIVVFVAITLGTILIFLLILERFHRTQKKKSLRRVGASVVLLVFGSLTIGIIWDIFALAIHTYEHTFPPLQYWIENPEEISNVLMFIGFIGAGLLWLRLYLYNFHSILERLSNITKCRLGIGNPLSDCWSYWFLYVVRRDLFSEDVEDKRNNGVYDDIQNSIIDMAVLGANATSEGEKIAVIRELNDILRNVKESITENSTQKNNTKILPPLIRGRLGRHKNFTITIKDSCQVIDQTATSESYEVIRRGLEVLDILLDLTKTSEDLSLNNYVAVFVIEKGADLLAVSTHSDNDKAREQLDAIVGKIQSVEQRNDARFRFALVGFESSNVNAFAQSLISLQGSRQSGFDYHVGLLALMAQKGDSARDWVKNTWLVNNPVEDEAFRHAYDFFVQTRADFETADAILDLAGYLKVDLHAENDSKTLKV